MSLKWTWAMYKTQELQFIPSLGIAVVSVSFGDEGSSRLKNVYWAGTLTCGKINVLSCQCLGISRQIVFRLRIWV